jgi:hypothetical protein
MPMAFDLDLNQCLDIMSFDRLRKIHDFELEVREEAAASEAKYARVRGKMADIMEAGLNAQLEVVKAKMPKTETPPGSKEPGA